MSLTSCYRYILELPVATLNEVLQAALSQSDSAGIAISQHWENVSIGSYTATIDATPADRSLYPSTLTLTSTDLGLILHLQLNLEVRINELPQLDAITYHLSFDFPGHFFKDTETPPVLLMNFPSVTVDDLNLVVMGGQIQLTPDLVEQKIHAMYAANPSFAHNVQYIVAWPPGPDTTVLVTTDIYDDPPGPGSRGTITAQVPDATHVIVVMPGHFSIKGLANPVYINTDMTVSVSIPVEQGDGYIRIKLSAVQDSDVTISFASSSIYDFFAKPVLASNIASKLRSLGDQDQTFPSDGQIRDMISERLVLFAHNLSIPVFTPQPPDDAASIDLTTFTPTTIDQQALALQLAALEDGTPCDVPTVFVQPTGFALAISVVEANQMLSSITQNNLGNRTVDGYDITINSLSAVLSDPGEHGVVEGHLWIEGEFTVHIACWPDPDISFHGPVFLTPVMNTDGTVVFTAQAGNFDADQPCCAHVSPAEIAALISGSQSTPVKLPQDFSGVGQLNLSLTSADIFADGIVVNGSFGITTMNVLHRNAIQKTLFWFNDIPLQKND